MCGGKSFHSSKSNSASGLVVVPKPFDIGELDSSKQAPTRHVAVILLLISLRVPWMVDACGDDNLLDSGVIQIHIFFVKMYDLC